MSLHKTTVTMTNAGIMKSNMLILGFDFQMLPVQTYVHSFDHNNTLEFEITFHLPTPLEECTPS